MNPRPCTPAVAVARALAVVNMGVRYGLGDGGFDPKRPGSPFSPEGRCDCSGFAASYCYQLPRSRPGFNRGPWSTVSDDISTDSIVEDAEHRNELFVVVEYPQPGDLVVNPAVRLPGGPARERIGHVGIIVAVPAEWDPKAPAFDKLTVVQCFPRLPPIQKTDGHLWMHRDVYEGQHNAAWRARIVRVVP